MSKIKEYLNSLLLFHEKPDKVEFILEENNKIDVFGHKNTKDQSHDTSNDHSDSPKDASKTKQNSGTDDDGEINIKINGQKKVSNNDSTKKENANGGSKDDGNSGKDGNSSNKDGSNSSSNEGNKRKISKTLKENLETVKKIYRVPQNSDLIIREFSIPVKEKTYAAFIVFFDGMVDRKVINDNILQPLMVLSNLEIKGNEKGLEDFISNHILPHDQIKTVETIDEIIDEINFGACGLFVDQMECAFGADVKGWEHRAVEKPNSEIVIRGPQEGFNEGLRTNTALIRKRLKDEDLVIENIEIGRRSKTPCALMYIIDIANSSLVDEVRRRISQVEIDYLLDSGELEQMIEDKTLLSTPQMISTERPDMTCSALTRGKVAVLVNGSPFALIMPANNFDLLHSAEDHYLRFTQVNLLRFIRLIAVTSSLLLPGIFLAIVNYHTELIPTDLLLAIEASREKVPFPAIVEILIMEFSFELIREAGIRIPGPIGPTLGIIGALILGQAAVAANIVSPILIIIVAVTGIGSFAIPNYSFAYSTRILKFVYITLGTIAGLPGITFGIFVHGLILVNTKSFGVPFLVPFAPVTAGRGAGSDEIMRGALWNMDRRQDYLNPKDDFGESKVSRKWIHRRSGEKGSGK